MAINFEAANMAGYNNPKIEVFTAHSNENMEIDNAPIKSEILHCLNRGCIPMILLSANDAALPATTLMFLFAGAQGENNPVLSFQCTFAFEDGVGTSTLIILYRDGDGSLPSIAT